MLISKIKKFLNLPINEKWWFVEAWLILGVMRAAILVFPFRKLAGSLKQVTGEYETPVLRESEQETAVKVGKIIVTAANHTPWQSACLVQSLAARRMLERRGIPGVIFLGVAKGDNRIENMKAHAWTQCGKFIVTGRIGTRGFPWSALFCGERKNDRVWR